MSSLCDQLNILSPLSYGDIKWSTEILFGEVVGKLWLSYSPPGMEGPMASKKSGGNQRKLQARLAIWVKTVHQTYTISEKLGRLKWWVRRCGQHKKVREQGRNCTSKVGRGQLRFLSDSIQRTRMGEACYIRELWGNTIGSRVSLLWVWGKPPGTRIVSSPGVKLLDKEQIRKISRQMEHKP